jgi:hypothetical protein
MSAKAANVQKEYGDFQTPLSLARRVTALLRQAEKHVATVVEPTCGVGVFLKAAAESFGSSPHYRGFDINEDYVDKARTTLVELGSFDARVERCDFYSINWEAFFSQQVEPLLIIGNPPWITNAGMGTIGGSNLPAKSNRQGHTGLDAKTGKSNFDISEWMLLRLLSALKERQATMAVLCKTATARKVLRHAWLRGLRLSRASLHLIDAAAEFGVSVDACLLYARTGEANAEFTATLYPSLSFDDPLSTFGLSGGELISDLNAYKEVRDLDGKEHRKWRSGVKHDSAQVMELTKADGAFVNGFGETIELEEEYVFPLLKSSDIANGRLQPTRFVLLPQRKVGDPTDEIRHRAPKTWRYLISHAEQLDNRGSSVYTGRARFSIFGVGDYSFSPAKVAISGFYKNVHFRALGSANGKPIVVDDTCYFLPCASENEASFFAELLNSAPAQQLLSSLVFKDAKRPITVDILRRIDFLKLAQRRGRLEEATEYLSPALKGGRQGSLFA